MTSIKVRFFLLSLIFISFSSKAFTGEDPKNFKTEFFKNLQIENSVKINNAAFNAGDQKKSGFLGVCLSLLLPGMGELYADRFDIGKYSVISEAGLWLVYAGINTYGIKVRNDGRTFAQIHAGFSGEQKDDDYYINVANFNNIYTYNDKKLRDRYLSKVYSVNSNLSWQWDSEDNRLKFRDMRVNGEEVLNNLKYVSIALIGNRIISAINAARLVHSYNNSLLSSINVSLLPTRSKDVIDGLTFNFSKIF
jgi:hypothetical protein